MAGLDRTRDALFVERLHAKTLARGIQWQPTEHEGRYQARIGEFVIEIGEGAGGEEHELLICGADGRAMELLTPDLLTPAAEGAPSRQEAFAETYEGARRAATGVDKAIDSLIAALG